MQFRSQWHFNKVKLTAQDPRTNTRLFPESRHQKIDELGVHVYIESRCEEECCFSEYAYPPLSCHHTHTPLQIVRHRCVPLLLHLLHPKCLYNFFQALTGFSCFGSHLRFPYYLEGAFFFNIFVDVCSRGLFCWLFSPGTSQSPHCVSGDGGVMWCHGSPNTWEILELMSEAVWMQPWLVGI